MLGFPPYSQFSIPFQVAHFLVRLSCVEPDKLRVLVCYENSKRRNPKQRHNFRAVHTNKDKPSRRRRALFFSALKSWKDIALTGDWTWGSGEEMQIREGRQATIEDFGKREMWPDLLEQMLSTGQQGRAANSYVYTNSMGHTRASNRHTTPPTHTGALSYSRECVWLGAYVFTEEVLDSVRE